MILSISIHTCQCAIKNISAAAYAVHNTLSPYTTLYTCMRIWHKIHPFILPFVRPFVCLYVHSIVRCTHTHTHIYNIRKASINPNGDRKTHSHACVSVYIFSCACAKEWFEWARDLGTDQICHYCDLCAN